MQGHLLCMSMQEGGDCKLGNLLQKNVDKWSKSKDNMHSGFVLKEQNHNTTHNNVLFINCHCRVCEDVFIICMCFFYLYVFFTGHSA